VVVLPESYESPQDRPLAIKVLLEERYGTRSTARGFLLSKSGWTLSHPNIVTIYDIGEVNDRPYIAMELLEGESLDAYMKSGSVRSLR
jgi:serine/threonine-protein kinase